jgi:hypothetical protein
LREQLPAHGIEAGFLIVAQRIVKIRKGGVHGLDPAQAKFPKLFDSVS